MSKIDLVWFLVAGLVGAFGSFERNGGLVIWGRSLAWGIIALWSFLALIGVL